MVRLISLSILSSQPTYTTILTSSISLFSRTTFLKNGFVSFLRNPTRFYCNCSGNKYRIPPEYADAFSRRISLAALKPHHRIAMGVSGGADSMALCALMAHWKTSSNDTAYDNSGFISGLLAIIVDHGLRSESNEEAQTVSRWVSDMGIRCEVSSCDWPNGGPMVGHLEEEARDMRYQIFQDICFRNRISVLLTAHHADDQAELFILRFSRDSGVLGLAGMAFSSQLFPKFPDLSSEPLNNVGLQLIRPLLEFTKEDLYKINEAINQKWVEDPTNTSSLFARNRIRMSLSKLNTCAFRSELQAVISVCRQTRSYVDHICQILLKETVTIMPRGYAIIDLEKLNSLSKEEICLTRFLAIVLQFISQRHRPVRGSALKLLLEYVRSFPCKTSFTAAGCYICPAPGTKGTKFLVCCSAESALPIDSSLYSIYTVEGLKSYIPGDMQQIIMEQKTLSEHLVPNASEVHFLDNLSSNSVLKESRRLNILSKSTSNFITELQTREKQLFKSKKEELLCSEPMSRVNAEPLTREPFQPGKSCYFMNRFFLTWRYNYESDHGSSKDGDRLLHRNCSLCPAGDKLTYLHHMIDEDWIYLAKLCKEHGPDKLLLSDGQDPVIDKINFCLNHARSSAQQALKFLKALPVAARRGLPVIVNAEGMLLSVPSIGFSHCPSVMISAEFRPRVPLGGGHSSFI